MVVSTVSAKIRGSLEILTRMNGISEADLCRETSISQATLWRLLNGDTDPRASTLNAIASYFNVTVDQILGNQPITKNSVKNIATSDSTLYLPVFSLKNPPELIKMSRKANPSNWEEWIEVESTINSACFAVEVSGDSMWPTFIEGVLIIVNPLINAKNKNYVLCRPHKSNEIIFRQYIEEKGEKFLKPIHYAYKTLALQKNDELLGVIVQSKNKFID